MNLSASGTPPKGTTELIGKLEELVRWFQEQGSALIALSGGVDSSVVAAVAHRALGSRALAVTALTATTPSWEVEDADKVAKLLGIRHRVISYDELANAKIVANQPDRCYHCRAELAQRLKAIAEEEGIAVIVDGTNADDLSEYRPGLRALREAGVRSPLLEVGLRKEEVRGLARLLGLPNADKPSNACLASRFPYGQVITPDAVKRVAKAELFIRRLTGVRQLRVRDHNGIARIEVGREERRLFYDDAILDAIADELLGLGFKYVALDMRGYKAGSLSKDLSVEDLSLHL